jgi:hypothetical protein
MYIEPQTLLGPLAKRKLEMLCLWFPQPAHNIFPEVALGRFLKLVRCRTPRDEELKRFLFSSTSIDALLTDSNTKPIACFEFQSSYHDSPEAQERDRKKAELILSANIPLLYTRLREVGLLEITFADTKDSLTFNLFTGEGREEAKQRVLEYLSF